MSSLNKALVVSSIGIDRLVTVHKATSFGADVFWKSVRLLILGESVSFSYYAYVLTDSGPAPNSICAIA